MQDSNRILDDIRQDIRDIVRETSDVIKALDRNDQTLYDFRMDMNELTRGFKPLMDDLTGRIERLEYKLADIQSMIRTMS